MGMVTPLQDAEVNTCGGKAAALAVLARAGLPVPDGFVIPFAVHRAARTDSQLPVTQRMRNELAWHLAQMGDVPVAVRSSAASEDTASGSGAGQYESVLAVQGAHAAAEAIRVCWASASSARATDYWNQLDRDTLDGEVDMAVIVQRLIDADVSGVMFTPVQPGDSARIEASWGLGLGVVGGSLTPDTYEVAADGGIRRTFARKLLRLDRGRHGVVASEVPASQQETPTLDDATVANLAALGGCVAALFDQPQDIEWAIAAGKAWILQARPITKTPPVLPAKALAEQDVAMIGTPGAHGIVTGIARVLRGPSDFPRLQPGDIAICPYTDPAWTPLFRIAAAVVTEAGGVLSHAAIVAREYGIPAVLGIRQATALIQDGTRITVDGTKGTIADVQE